MLFYLLISLILPAAAMAPAEDPVQSASAEARAAYLEFEGLESAIELAARLEAVRLRDPNDELLYWMALCRLNGVPGFTQLPIDASEALESLAERDPRAKRMLEVIRLSEQPIQDERALVEQLGRDALAAGDAVVLLALAEAVLTAANRQGRWTGLEQLAVSFAERALELGNQRASYTLAFLRLQVDRDVERGVPLLREAASAGDYRAAFQLSRLYAAGVFVAQSEPEAARWLEAAAAMNHPSAIRELGYAEAEGWSGAEPNLPRARMLFERAMELGDADAALTVARGRLYGDFGYERDVQGGLAIIRELAELEHPRAMYILGLFHSDGSFGVPMDRGEGERLLRRAAELGDEVAIRRLRSDP